MSGSSDHWRWSRSPIRTRPSEDISPRKRTPEHESRRSVAIHTSDRWTYVASRERPSINRSRSPRHAQSESVDIAATKHSRNDSRKVQTKKQSGIHSVTIEGPDEHKKYRARCVFTSGAKTRAVTGPWRINFDSATDDSEKFRFAFKTGGHVALIDLNNFMHSLDKNAPSLESNVSSPTTVKTEILCDVPSKSEGRACTRSGTEGLSGESTNPSKSACSMWVGQHAAKRVANSGTEIVKSEDSEYKLEFEESSRGHRAILQLLDSAASPGDGGCVLAAPWRKSRRQAQADGNRLQNAYTQKGAAAAQQTKNELLRSTAASLSISYRKSDETEGDTSRDIDGQSGTARSGNNILTKLATAGGRSASTKALVVSVDAEAIVDANADPRIEKTSRGFRAVCAFDDEGSELYITGPTRMSVVQACRDADDLEVAHHTGGIALAHSCCADLLLEAKSQARLQSKDAALDKQSIRQDEEKDEGEETELEISHTSETRTRVGGADAMRQNSFQVDRKELRRKPSLERYHGSRKVAEPYNAVVAPPCGKAVGSSSRKAANAPKEASRIAKASSGITAADMVAAATELISRSRSGLPPLANPIEVKKQSTGHKAMLVPRTHVQRQRSRSRSRRRSRS